jgi:alpha-glucosidase
MGEYTFLKGDKNWWRQAVIYQIYPRSFADGNGDGIGDLKGIISRVPYLKSLGIDAVWMSPFYPSALADGGYDVDDYRNVDPRIGNLDEFDQLVSELHKNGMRLIADLVPNHSGDNHVWFQAALKAKPGSPERDRYIFRDGKGANGEIRPSELSSHFGPTGWTRITEPDGTPGQWYMHLFAKEQPDWNWDNQEVRDDFIKTLRFWSDRGVDGYRVDVAHALIKNLKDGHLPERQSYDVSVMKDDGTDDLFDRDEVHEVYASWRNVFNEYGQYPDGSTEKRPFKRLEIANNFGLCYVLAPDIDISLNLAYSILPIRNHLNNLIWYNNRGQYNEVLGLAIKYKIHNN